MLKNLIYVRYLLVAVVFMLTLQTVETNAAPGDLDTSFGNGGKVEYSSPNDLFMKRIALQADGKILIAGWRNTFHITSQTQRLYLLRYNADGSLDTSFGRNGEAVDQVTPGSYAYIYAIYPSKIAIQTDGSILIGAHRLSNNGGFLGLAVWKFTAEGILDKSFDGDGRKDLPGSPGQLIDPTDKVEDVLLTKTTVLGTAQTKILVLCTYENNNDYGAEYTLAESSAVFRLNLDGRLDTGFGQNGRTGLDDEFNDAAVYKPSPGLTDEYIYLAGIDNDNPAVRRLTNNGAIDTTFAVAGVASIGEVYYKAAFRHMVIGKDGKIYLSGFTNPAAGILSTYTYLMSASGVFEQSFGTSHHSSGIGYIYNGGAYDAGIGLQPDGMLLVGTNYNVSRYWADGRLNAFYTTYDNGISCLAVQKDKKAVVLTNVWTQEQGDYRNYKLTRYLAD